MGIILKLSVLSVAVAIAAAVPATKHTKSEASRKIYPGLNCSGRIEGDYPHPTKCTHFISCVGGTTAYEIPCAGNLHFVPSSGPDPRTSRCDYPHLSGCTEGSSGTPAKSTLPPSSVVSTVTTTTADDRVVVIDEPDGLPIPRPSRPEDEVGMVRTDDVEGGGTVIPPPRGEARGYEYPQAGISKF